MKLFVQNPNSIPRRAYVNLDLFAQSKGQSRCVVTPNPYLKATVCTELVREAALSLRASYTYGGYGENRSVLWRDSYLEEGQKFIHLGIDVNASERSSLHAPFDATVLAVGDDTKIFGKHGWGRWCIMRTHYERDGGLLFVFAHLGLLPKVDERFREGAQFATIGSSKVNGGWYPHVHVQVVNSSQHTFFSANNSRRDDYVEFMNVLDGYASVSDFARDAGRVYHDPLNWIW